MKRAMRRFHPLETCLIFAFAIAACAESAVAMQQQQVPNDLKQAIVEWSSCRSSIIAKEIESNNPEAMVVDTAMNQCKTFEAKAMQLWEKSYGPGSSRQLTAIKARSRISLIKSVRSARAGKAPADPYASWGQCIGNTVLSANSSRLARNAKADAALKACSKQERAVQNTIVAKHGGSIAAEQIKVLRAEMRKQALAAAR